MIIQLDTLVGMLTDTARSTSDEVGFENSIGGVVLHSTPGDGDGSAPAILYATSTNNYLVAQCWAEVDAADLGPTLLPRESVQTLLAALKTGLGRAHVQMAREDSLLRVMHPGGGTVAVPVGEPDANPAARFDPSTTVYTEDDVNRSALYAARLLEVFVRIARRRSVGVRFVRTDPTRPAEVTIGTQYRALLMPVRDDAVGPRPWAVPQSKARR